MNDDNSSRPKGLSTLPTSEIALAPEFLDGVKRIAPKPKRSKIWIVLLLAIAGAGGFFGWKRWQRTHHVETAAATSEAPTTTATATASVEPVASASVAVAPSVTASAPPSAQPSASASAAPTVKIVKVRRRGPATR